MSKRPKTSLELKVIEPLTHRQEISFEQWAFGDHLVLQGSAGTGKTFLALYLALNELSQDQRIKNVKIIRSTVQSRDMGFMPGTEKEKIAYFETPYHNILNELYHRGDAYQILKDKRIIEFKPTSFLRGLTFDNSVIIIDEIQNMNFAEINTVLTRVGENSRLILCGDFSQTDLLYRKEKSGINDAIRILEKMPNVTVVTFTEDDIVRSGFVKDWIVGVNDYTLNKPELLNESRV